MGTAPLGVRDFSHLLRPEIFHQLSPLSIPPPFRNTSKQPTPETPISELLAHGHFRAAAIASVQALTSSPVSATIAAAHPPVEPTDYARVFSLLYIRLACLCLIDSVPLAAQEAKALEDLNQVHYLDPMTGAHLMPWELRLLAIRLQTLGFGDPRRAIMSYYDMAREAHLQIAKAAKAHEHSELELWKRRLAELGVKVGGALIEMEDLAGAAAHMATLRDHTQDGRLATAKALLWLHLGDVDAACRCVRDSKGGEVGEEVVLALVDMANGHFEDGLKKWTELKAALEEKGLQDEMVGVNMAVCLLYLGRMQEVSLHEISSKPMRWLTTSRGGEFSKTSSTRVSHRGHFFSISVRCTNCAQIEPKHSRRDWLIEYPTWSHHPMVGRGPTPTLSSRVDATLLPRTLIDTNIIVNTLVILFSICLTYVAKVSRPFIKSTHATSASHSLVVAPISQTSQSARSSGYTDLRSIHASLAD